MLLIFVGLAIVAFVLTDSQQMLMGSQSRDVGTIAGESISQEQFINYVESIKNNYIQNGLTVNETMMQNIRNQAWDQMIYDIVYADLFNETGLSVTSAERVDMVQGANIAPVILQNFGDPATGTIDRESLNNYLASLNLNPQARINWEILESQIAADRIRTKYDNLIAKTNYATLPEAQREYNSQLDGIDVDYVYFPYSSVPDSTISVTDADLRAYLSEHSEEYQVPESRSLEYVIFPIIPSAADSASYWDEMERYRQQLLATEDDSTYAIVTTEQGIGFSTYTPRTLPGDLPDNIGGMKEGDIIGPKLTDGVFSMYKLSAIEKAETKFVKASHILINTEGMSDVDKRAARNRVNGLLRQLRNGADFAQLARENSDDSSAPLGGDLGWYEENTGWDPEFEKAAFSRRTKGLVNRVVESQFGYHLIKVDEVPTANRYKIASIQIEMAPSIDTRNEVYMEMAEFAADATSYDRYTELTNEKGYSVFSGSNIESNSSSIGSLRNARSIVIWLFNEAERGDVKDFELDDQYVVAVHTNRVSEGTADLESVRLEIEGKVRNEKKLEALKTRVGALSGSLAEMATAYGPQARFYSSNALRLNSNSLPNVGNAPEAIGAAYGLINVGDRTSVVGVDLGVVLLELKGKTSAAEIADYTAYENQIVQRLAAQARFTLAQSIKDRANVTDERYKYY